MTTVHWLLVLVAFFTLLFLVSSYKQWRFRHRQRQRIEREAWNQMDVLQRRIGRQ